MLVLSSGEPSLLLARNWQEMVGVGELGQVVPRTEDGLHTDAEHVHLVVYDEVLHLPGSVASSKTAKE
jgi:hypothetical protein